MNLLTVEPVPTPQSRQAPRIAARGLAYQGPSSVLGQGVWSSWGENRGNPELSPHVPDPYALTRPFGMDGGRPRTNLVLWTCWRAGAHALQRAWCNETVNDPVTSGGTGNFPTAWAWRRPGQECCCIDALGAMGFGFVEVGTVTPKAQPGNPATHVPSRPRPAPSSTVGFNNEACPPLSNNVQQAQFRKQTRQHSPMLLGLNIGKNATTPIENATSDYLICPDGVPSHADYVTVNISSPTQNLRTATDAP